MGDTYILTNDEPPKEQLKKLVQCTSRQDIAQFAKDININWKPTDNPNIDWMRASMAIQNNFELFKNSWNAHVELQYQEEISEELTPITEDKSPEYLYCSGDFQPKELLLHSETESAQVGDSFYFLEENVQIDQILGTTEAPQYVFSYQDKIVILNKLELNNLPLIESFIRTKFDKLYLNCSVGRGNPIRFWQKSQYSFEETLQEYYLDTVLVFKQDSHRLTFTKTRNGWRYLSFSGRLYWFSSQELAYIGSNLKLIQKQFP